MKAAVVTEKGIEIREVPAPKPKPGELLVRVRACGLNRAEVMMASGYRHGNQGGAGTILGLEFVGRGGGGGSRGDGLQARSARDVHRQRRPMPNMPWPMPGARRRSPPTT